MVILMAGIPGLGQHGATDSNVVELIDIRRESGAEGVATAKLPVQTGIAFPQTCGVGTLATVATEEPAVFSVTALTTAKLLMVRCSRLSAKSDPVCKPGR